jgi:hypothetical protein
MMNQDRSHIMIFEAGDFAEAILRAGRSNDESDRFYRRFCDFEVTARRHLNGGSF